MEKITSLITQLKNHSLSVEHLKNIKFVAGDYFGWDRQQKTIVFQAGDAEADAYTLHEYGHALLDHDNYTHDVSLVAMEREAWDRAVQIAVDFDLTIDPDLIESSLDTYRDWLHSRSLCPQCQSTGIQIAPYNYSCIACSQKWSVNEARKCSLRRNKLKYTPAT